MGVYWNRPFDKRIIYNSLIPYYQT